MPASIDCKCFQILWLLSSLPGTAGLIACRIVAIARTAAPTRRTRPAAPVTPSLGRWRRATLSIFDRQQKKAQTIGDTSFKKRMQLYARAPNSYPVTNSQFCNSAILQFFNLMVWDAGIRDCPRAVLVSNLL